jgi:hypothetical protein
LQGIECVNLREKENMVKQVLQSRKFSILAPAGIAYKHFKK